MTVVEGKQEVKELNILTIFRVGKTEIAEKET